MRMVDILEQHSFRKSQGNKDLLPFFEILFVEMKPRPIKKRGHIVKCACSSSSMIKIK